MKTQIHLLLGLALVLSSKAALAHGVTNAKASELSLHRVERLVALCNLGDPNQPHNMPGMPGYDPTKCKNDPSKPKKGIDPDYQNKVAGLITMTLAHQNEDEPSFKTTVFQYKSQDGSQRAVEIILDEEGRPLTYQELAGGPAQNAPTWPDKDATTLSENALHYVLEGAVTKPELKPYNEKLTSLAITQGKNAQGQTVAAVDFTADGETKALRVRVKTNGDFDSAEFIN